MSNKNRAVMWDWKEPYPADELYDLLQEWGEGAHVYHIDSRSDLRVAIVTNNEQDAIDFQEEWDKMLEGGNEAKSVREAIPELSEEPDLF